MLVHEGALGRSISRPGHLPAGRQVKSCLRLAMRLKTRAVTLFFGSERPRVATEATSFFAPVTRLHSKKLEAR
ncbi:hypothetical protein FNF27_04009 [Cafeteria roenbergensis]|uniref:Uncharacterized protein n=1 Tax=Cafeteria roenbergensis TaxID=33653 RepID=A0A5A8CAG4_CAFRO|nr:hypothetical protein FNF31_07188 [Cafeteria roenbergensis]KAA0174635.1 hypothetical protein FNF27_04009 [Cafeteria roenbergensis]